MSYEPTTWKAGDTVTSEKLNKIEQGIVNNNTMIIECELQQDNDNNKIMLSTTSADDIWNAYKIGTRILFHCPSSTYNSESYIEMISCDKRNPGAGGSLYSAKCYIIGNLLDIELDDDLNKFYFGIYVD